MNKNFNPEKNGPPVTEKISRAQWQQIAKRVKQANGVFDPKWKCLIDGQRYDLCLDHGPEDNHEIIRQVREKNLA